MNKDETEIALRLLNSYWPIPEMGDDEMDVWMKELLGCDFEEAARVMEILVGSGVHYRPVAGEFIAEYRRQRLRPQKVPALPMGSVATLDDAHGHFSAARAALAEAKERYARDAAARQERVKA